MSGSHVRERWPLTVACPANNKYRTVLEIQKNLKYGTVSAVKSL